MAGLAAMGVVVSSAALGAFSAVKTSTMTVTGRRHWPKTLLYVCANMRDADAIHYFMGRPKNVKCIGIGSMLCGYRADTIVLDEYDEAVTMPQRMVREQWFQQSVATRLTPGGEIVKASMKIHSFNFDTECGVAMEFRTDKKVLRQAARHWKPQRFVTHENILQSKALILLWYARQLKIDLEPKKDPANMYSGRA
jgi:hypothetical protein